MLSISIAHECRAAFEIALKRIEIQYGRLVTRGYKLHLLGPESQIKLQNNQERPTGICPFQQLINRTRGTIKTKQRDSGYKVQKEKNINQRSSLVRNLTDKSLLLDKLSALSFTPTEHYFTLQHRTRFGDSCNIPNLVVLF